MRLVFQTALEAEVTEFLGWDRYARGEHDRDGHPQRLQPGERQDDSRDVTLQRRSPPGCWAPASPAPTHSSPSSSLASCGACRCATWRRASPTARAGLVGVEVDGEG